MSDAASPAGSLRLIGGALAVDYVNTMDDHNSGHPKEYLTSYAELVSWSRHANVLDARDAQRLLERAEDEPSEAEGVLRRAVELRDALYRLFSAIAADGKPRPADLQVLNRELSKAMVHARISPAPSGFVWDWTKNEALDGMLHPIARSAADLLTSGDVERVRECGADVCGWLFVDTSKNHSRRWCSMDSCGNRAKARRHYHRSGR
jgi:predicted RNA-binding Zn ribbon-like protein